MNSKTPQADLARSQRKRNTQQTPSGKNITVFSAGGKLHTIYDFIGERVTRSRDYTQVDFGRPLAIEFLRFHVPGHNWERRGVEILISNHLKTRAEKSPAAESIVYYDKNKKLDPGQPLDIKSWGAKNYGHPLCYYSKSYHGESIQLTTYVTELDKMRKSIIENLRAAMNKIGDLPLFLPYMQFMQAAKLGVKAAEVIANFINTDDVLIPEFDLDLHFVGGPNQPHLQSGRYVCLPNCTLSRNEIISQFRLENDNQLVDSRTNKLYQGAFFILSVNSYENPQYEEFEYFFEAASILGEINRQRNMPQLIKEMVELAHEAHDVQMIREIENWSVKPVSAERDKKIESFWKDLSEDMQTAYRNRYNSLHHIQL